MKINERNRQNSSKHNHSYVERNSARLQPLSTSNKPDHYPHNASLLFFGNERLATGVETSVPTLTALIDAGYNVAAVITNFTAATSRKSRELEIKNIAEKNNIPVLMPDKLSVIKEQLKSYDALCGVLVAYGRIVPDDIINLFKHGIINVHPSMLPKHRGSTPIESVLLSGETTTGVSIMQLVSRMDAGPVYAQQQVDLKGSETKQELADTLGKLGSKMIVDSLPLILKGKLKPKLQDEGNATYDSLITKLDGAIDWNMRAEAIERQIRAFTVWPGSRAIIKGKEVVITDAEIADYTGIPGEAIIQDKQLVVCAGEKAIQINKLIPAGKNEMTGQAFIAGYFKK